MGQVGSGGVKKIAGRVGSGQEVLECHGSSRVGSGGFFVYETSGRVTLTQFDAGEE